MPTTMTGTAEMAGADAYVIRFQCPKCGHELEQTIGNLKLSGHMRCGGCGVGINIDTNRLANAADEMRSAMEKVPPEITIKFFH
jgi:transcription elongation factor Elf1